MQQDQIMGQLVKWMYTGVIFPMFSYAAMVWAHEISSKKLKQILQSFERIAMLAFATVKCSTPTEGLRVLYGVQSLEILLKQSAMLAYVR